MESERRICYVAFKIKGCTQVKNFPSDPVFPEYGDPKPADLACCIDVLEHVEPKQLDNVLAILLRSQQVLAFSPST
jgi:hypothetical protein